MIDLNKVSNIYIQDLLDDMLDNDSKHLYQFVGHDCKKAFFLTMYIEEWQSYLEPFQMRLYSREIRHAPLELEPYQKQFDYWSSKYYNDNKDKEVLITDYPQYILNNWISTSDEDPKVKINLAITLALNMLETKNVQQVKPKRRGRPPKKKTNV